jgi:hypothetical protein
MILGLFPVRDAHGEVETFFPTPYYNLRNKNNYKKKE